jgi:23S rRNA (uracil1939-C5)-methyltransferase
MHAPDIKNIVVRYSYHEDVCIGVVYVTERNASRIDLGMVSGLKGWSVVYSDPLSPAAKVTTVLSSGGAMFLEEEIAGKVFRYRYDGFFQVNPPSFSEIITWLEEYAPKGGVCLDMYAGVGTIGISLSHLFDRVIASEIDTAATDMIQENALRNGVSNLSSVFAGPAEKQNIRDGAGDTDVLIVDPPRSGMHPKVLRDIAETMPPYIIYVSCNPHTQVRDMAELRHLYSPTAWRLFDLYPQTPHVESVLILKAHS